MVVNLAAELQDVSTMQATNVEGTASLLAAMIGAGVDEIVHLSSVGVVGAPHPHRELVVDESMAPTPQNSYETTEAASERLIVEAAEQGQVRASIARPTNVFGEGHPRDALLRLMTRLSAKAPVPVGSRAWSKFVYVDDVAAAVTHLVQESPGGTFNVGEATPLLQLMRTIKETIDGRAPIMTVPTQVSAGLAAVGINTLDPVSNAVIYDDRKLRKTFRYPVGVTDGLRRTVDDFQRRNLLPTRQ